MRLKFQKTVALILLTVFLAVSSAGSVFGCSECVDGEKSQRVNTSVSKCCCTNDLRNSHGDSHDVPVIYQLGDEHQGSCLDCSTLQDSSVFSKRTKRISAAATIAAISNYSPLTAAKDARLVVGNLATQPPTRTSQTLLAHRTVVLLN